MFSCASGALQPHKKERTVQTVLSYFVELGGVYPLIFYSTDIHFLSKLTSTHKVSDFARIVVERLFRTVEYDYPQFHLSMQCFLCRIESGHPVLLEHEAARWLFPAELDSVEWLPADR